MILAAVDWLHYLFMIPLALISVFLTLVILVQRGRGGGLTGALGGMGGASAFGTKAGDLFTKVTIGVAFVWVVLSMASLKILNQRGQYAGLNPNVPGTGTVSPATGDKEGDKSGGKSTPGAPASKAPASKTPATKIPSAAKAPPPPPAPPAGESSEPAPPASTTP